MTLTLRSGFGLVSFALLGIACSGSETSESVGTLQEPLTFVESNGIVSMEAENFTTNTSQGGKSWTPQTTNSPSNGTALIATPDTGAAVNTGYTTGSPRLNFTVTFSQTGTYQVWIRGRAGGASAADSDSVHVGLDNVALSSSDRITGFSSSFGWSRSTIDNVNATINVGSTGSHTVNVWMREDGFVFDKLVLARNASYTPTGTGPAETPSATCSNGATRTGTTVCGPNGRGRLQQQCTNDNWVDTTTCIDGDVCTDNATRTGTTSCGLNGRGFFQQRCTTGQWANTTTCLDPDACTDGTTRRGTTPCPGGMLDQLCTTGQWVDTATCNVNACGNGACNQNENCNSCAADCGACPPPAFLESAGLIVMEAESRDATSANGSSDNWSQVASGSASGGQEMQVGPDNNTTWTSNPTTTAPRLDFRAYFTTTGTWNLWVKGRSSATNQTSGDSCWGGIDNTPNSSYFDFADNGATGWFSKSITVNTKGQHTISLWGREDGFFADKVLLAKSTSYTPTGNGPAQSARGGGVCGDAVCSPTEDCSSCSADCGACTTCGNGTCESGETCSNCAPDCGACPTPGLDARPSNTTCVAPAPLAANYAATDKWPNVSFTNPMQVVQPPGDNTRLIVVERAGAARAVPINATSQSNVTTFLQLSNVVTSSNGGFLSMAFHPNWATNRYVYVVYTTSNRMKRLSRFQSTSGGTSINASTEQIVLQSQHLTEFNHNGGQIAFGHDGYLYLSTGDDAYLNYTRARHAAQTNNLFGKVLRIDVDNGTPYSIPPSNPFASGGGSPEVYAYGFRNPWRFSFDKATGELWLGDVGEDMWEEINVVTPGFYGWPYYEGTSCFSGNSTDCSTPYTAPRTTYGGGSAQSLSGGFVYRGTALPSLYGKYVYGDYVTGQVSYFDPAAGTKTDITGTTNGGAIVGFGQDNAGELYVVRYSAGKVHQLIAGSGGGATDFPAQLSGTGCFTSASPPQPVSSAIPYSIAQSFWSDGAAKERFLALPNGTQISVDSSGDWELPPGGVTIKSFRLNGQLFETRFFVRHSNGTYSGYTYQWNEAQTQATLVPPGGATRNIAGLTWTYPSRSQCFACHGQAPKGSLGIETRQLNVDGFYPSTGRTANQFYTLTSIGMLTGNLASLAPFPAIADQTASLESRAMAYLHVNCASCHRPGGIGGGNFDTRFDTAFANKNLCNVNPGLGDLGIAGAKLVKPGDHAGSIVWQRTSTRQSFSMPPLASTIADSNGAALLQQWLDSLTSCPAP